MPRSIVRLQNLNPSQSEFTMVPKTLAKAISKWPTGDLADLLNLIHVEIHKRADAAREQRSKGKRVAGRPAK